jgi:hypothetical protein
LHIDTVSNCVWITRQDTSYTYIYTLYIYIHTKHIYTLHCTFIGLANHTMRSGRRWTMSPAV